MKAAVSECETVAVDENEGPDASDSEEGAVERDDTREAQEEKLHNKLPKSLLKELLNIENAVMA